MKSKKVLIKLLLLSWDAQKNLLSWDKQESSSDKKATFYDMIAQDKEIVKVILLLTGSI